MKATHLLSFTLLATSLAAQTLRPAPTHLLTEHTANPLGIDAPHPRLNWQLTFPERGAIQTAYEIQAAPSVADLQKSKLTWDTQKTTTDQSQNIPYNGPELTSSERLYWRVRVWDKAGNPSAWSEPNFFETGLLHPSDWQASYITSPTNDPTKPASVPYLRKSFPLNKPIRSARLYATALGLYELQLNGTRVGDQQLAPGWTDYESRLQYQTYDVTSQLHQGPNALGAMIGDGWYRGPIGPYSEITHGGPRLKPNNYGDRIALLAQLVVTFTDGTTQTIPTDNTWKSAPSPILFSEIYDGETYDARLEQPGWSSPNFDDHAWSPVAVYDHTKQILIAQAAPPVREIEQIKPIAITHSPHGETIFDLGQNFAGWIRLNVHGPAGTTIILHHAEVLDKDGNLYTANLRDAKQTVSYTLRGTGEETFEPHFTYQGFRYVAVEGFPGTPTLANLTGIVLHSDMTKTGVWESSNAQLNRLQANIVWSERGNFVAIPTDCPQRDERLGWLADAQIFARTSAFNYDVDTFFTGWLRDLALDQKPDGDLPNVIPDARHARLAPGTESRSGWGDAAIIVPWTLYLTYGDKQVLQEQYPSMKAWMEWLRRRNPDFILHYTAYQHGDWLAYAAPPAEARAFPGATTGLDLADTAYFAYSASLMVQAANALNKPEDAASYQALFNNIKTAFNHEFVTPSGRVGENTQTAYALALEYNLLPDDLREQAITRLNEDVHTHKDHLTTGFMGTPIITSVLTDGGHVDTAYKLLEQTTYPSWLYPITMGATTMWERWDAQKPDGSFQDPSMSSFNHYARGAIGDWMYRVVAGIDLDPAEPGYKHILLAPQPGGGLTFVHASLLTGYGDIKSAWKIEANTMHITFTIPGNTHATVKLPSATLATVQESSKPLTGRDDILHPTQQGSTVAFDLGSGTYEFVYPAAP